MLMPVTLYDVRAGVTADDPRAITLVTTRAQATADDLVRWLMQRRAQDLFVGAPEFFVVPREGTVDVESASAATHGRYELRFVLAAVPARESAPAAAPVAEEVDVGAEPIAEEKQP